LLLSTGSLHSAPRAVIVTGLSANETQAARLAALAATAREGLLARGLPAASILTLAPAPGAPLRRDAVLAALAPASSPATETWLILLGTSAPARDGQPAFQLSGPRLTATDLASAVSALPGKKFVVVATSASGGFLPPLLALPDVEAVAATAESGEINEPRFAEFWAETLVARPDAPFAALAAEAATRVAAFYASQSLAQGENARLIDRAANRIIPALDASARTATATFGSPTSPPPVDIAALSIPKPTADTEIELRPADPESLALLAAARAAAADTDHAALILRTEIEILVARDFSSRETTRFRAYVRTGEALDALGSLHLPFDPPFTGSRLITARVIRPDGSQRLLNPAARLAADANASREARDPDFLPSPSFIELPDLTADCLVEAEWTTEHRTDGTLPEFSREWHFARPYPQKSLQVTLTLPDSSALRAFAPHLPEPALADTTRTWTLADLPAREPLPFDPPARTFTPWLGVSSVASWDAFAAWYRRIATGSDTVGPEVEALAATLAAAHPDRASRIRAAYQTVAALRYVAIELGVGAFRPRTPEQVWRQRFGDCKDKANLLVALLARLGVEAEFALVNRFDTTFTEHPSWQFNHALARIPANPAEGQPRDLWLDATDRLVPPDVVAPGNLGRQALVFTRDFSTATFHEITAAQEPPAEWRETIAPHSSGSSATRIQIFATGSAGVALRRLLLGLSPAQRRDRLGGLLNHPVTAVSTPDPYDLTTPFVIDLETNAAPTSPFPPLAPGLAAYRAPADRPRLWDESRAWTYTRATPSTTESQPIPARLP
jgi:transglutaminase-like putative cysteine protease